MFAKRFFHVCAGLFLLGLTQQCSAPQSACGGATAAKLEASDFEGLTAFGNATAVLCGATPATKDAFGELLSSNGMHWTGLCWEYSDSSGTTTAATALPAMKMATLRFIPRQRAVIPATVVSVLTARANGVEVGQWDPTEVWFQLKQDSPLPADCSVEDVIIVGLQDGVWRLTERSVRWK